MTVKLYNTLLTFHDEYRATSDQDFEGAVTGVWDLLLNYYFNQSNGFIHRTEDKTIKGFININSYQWVVRLNAAGRVRTPFLVKQCKRTARETDKATWKKEWDQLQTYIKAMVARHSWPHPQYGITRWADPHTRILRNKFMPTGRHDIHRRWAISAIIVVNKWGEEGRQFLQINCAQNWTKPAARLAKAVPDYREPMSILVRAQIERFKAMKSGKTLNTDPGGTDPYAHLILFACLSSVIRPSYRSMNVEAAFIYRGYLRYSTKPGQGYEPSCAASMAILHLSQQERMFPVPGEQLPGHYKAEESFDPSADEPLDRFWPSRGSEEELKVYSVKVNSQGLLEPTDFGEKAAITDANNRLGEFSWQTEAGMPELPKAIIEALTDDEGGAEDTEQNNLQHLERFTAAKDTSQPSTCTQLSASAANASSSRV
ncbi:hypothetical protein CFD26_108065 [Aspergillus turcosus]|uniref:Uncharacterized protein n=1 Tax=Aspergillus turcosus TaxID=1245748 RepID=A0A421DBZ0_9EURO|nr:hypothetical protein CFD26_108065 [Aspergillus turcosus]